MSVKDFKELIQKVEDCQYEYDYLLPNIFRENCQNNQLTAEQQKRLESEFIFFSFRTEYSPGKPRFNPSVVVGDVVHPGEADLTKERLKYCYQRSLETNNPRMRARYLDLTYEYNDKKKADKPKLARKAAEAYIEASTLDYVGAQDKIDYVVRSFLLSRRHKDACKEIYEKAKNNLFNAVNSGGVDLLYLMDIVIRCKQDFQKEDFVRIRDTINKAIEHYDKKGDAFNFLKRLINLKYQVANILLPNTDNKKSRAEDLVRLYEGSSEKEEGFAKQSLLIKALKICQQAGLKDRAKELRASADKLDFEPRDLRRDIILTQIPEDLIREEADKIEGRANSIALYELPSRQKIKKISLKF